MSIPLFIPIFSELLISPGTGISSISDLLKAIWEEEKLRLSGQGVMFTQLSLRSLACPVPLQPNDTLCKRVSDSAHVHGWVDTMYHDKVPSTWCDTKNVQVYLYIDRGTEMQAAKKLHENIWGKDLEAMLEEIPDHEGILWKYIPKRHLDFLEMDELGYFEEALLLRAEYEPVFDELCLKAGLNDICRGVVLTGQPGIGKTCFLYYLLLRLLSRGMPVALERPQTKHFLVFRDDGVDIYPLKMSNTRVFPPGTIALSDSCCGKDKEPCSVFQAAARLRRAWIVQTTSPLEERYEQWKKQCYADLFVMDYCSINEITALGNIRSLKAVDLQRIYRKWGPSAHTCLLLSAKPGSESGHETAVKKAAARFVNDPLLSGAEFDATRVSDVLFSLRPKIKPGEKNRQILTADMATDWIKAIISYAALDAMAQVSAGHLFEKLVFSWFYAHPDVEPLRCLPASTTNTGLDVLQIPACGEEQTKFFDSNNDLQTVKMDRLPLCLLPTSRSFANHVGAIVLTDDFIITIQVTISATNSASVKGDGFTNIMESLPASIAAKKWCHVFITDNDENAYSLRKQRLHEFPSDIEIYSGVFAVDRPGISRKHLEALTTKMHCARDLKVIDGEEVTDGGNEPSEDNSPGQASGVPLAAKGKSRALPSETGIGKRKQPPIDHHSGNHLCSSVPVVEIGTTSSSSRSRTMAQTNIEYGNSTTSSGVSTPFGGEQDRAERLRKRSKMEDS